LSIPILETERLLLRPWRAADVAAYAQVIREPDVLRNWGDGLRYRAKRAAAGLLARVSDVEARLALRSMERHWQRHGLGMWALEEKASGRLIGSAGFTVLEQWTADPARVEIGWLLARHAWGRGFASEAARAGLRCGFAEFGLPRVVSVALAANRRSVRVMARIGLDPVGRVRWKRLDVVWYGIDRDDWCRASDTTPAARR
jgi:RimJ/RimL family protein N-acetyltransferase